jgi:hypothetical protein
MVSMAAAGLSLVVIFAMLTIGIYGALIPPQLDIEVRNDTGTSKEVVVDLAKDGERVRHWRETVMPGKTARFGYPMYLGGYDINVGCDTYANASARIDMPFFTFEKSRTETFSVNETAIGHGNIY